MSRFSVRTGGFQRRYTHEGGGYLYNVFSAEIAFGEGAAWTAANGPVGELMRVDADNGTARSIRVGRIPYAVAVDFDAVWVSDLVHPPEAFLEPEPGKVLRLDPVTGQIDDVINVGKRPGSVATGDGFVWVANGGEKTISQIDPRTNEVVRKIATPYYALGLAYGHGHLWVSLGSKPFAF